MIDAPTRPTFALPANPPEAIHSVFRVQARWRRAILWTLTLLSLAYAPVASAETDPITLAIEAAVEQRVDSVRIPAGTYHLDPSGPSHLRWRNLKNLHIDATDVTVVCSDASKAALIIDDAENLTIEGLTIDYHPLPFTQGRIESIEGGKRIKMRIADGYRADADYFDASGLAAYLYEPDGHRIKAHSPDLYPSSVTANPEDDRVLWLEHRSDIPTASEGVAIGDRIALTRRAVTAFRLNDTAQCVIRDVTVHAAPGIAILEAGGNGANRYERVRVVPGPPPTTEAGPAEPRLVSSIADGIHSSAVRLGPVVDGCEFAAMGDDAIAIHSSYAVVVATPDPRTVVLMPKYELPLDLNDRIRLYDASTFDQHAEPRAVSITQVSAAEANVNQDALERFRSDYRLRRESDRFFLVELDHAVDANPGDLAISPDRCGAGFRLTNNTMRPHRARAFMIKSIHGVIENNTVDGSSHAAMAIGPEIPLWLGGPATESLVVRNNTFANTGYHGSALYNRGNPVAATISVHAGTPNRTWITHRPNRDILFEGNTITDPFGPALLVASAEGVTLRDNRFNLGDRTFDNISSSRYGVDPSMDLWFDECANVTLVANTFNGRRPRIGMDDDAEVQNTDADTVERMPWPDGVESSPYDAHILTPRPPKTPRINAARVFGARPDAPINFLVATSGEDPIHFDATLPSGLSIDANSGLITGELHGPGDHVASITATNELGADTIEITFRVGDTIGLTPPMGWNSWNCWGKEVSQEKVLLSARALVDSGLIDHGWTYVNIDDAWQSRRGGPHNAIQPNDQFPDMAALCRDIHDMGLKVGTYSTPWVTSYAGFIGGSSDHVDGRWDESMNTHKNKRLAEHGFETEDARQWAEWGIDYLKYDWYPNDVPHTKAMRDALDATGRDILLSLSNKAPQDVASELAANSNLARTTRDIRDQWRWTGPHVHQGIADIWDKHDAWREHCRPGFFPDADMLVVGRVGWKDAHQPTRLTPDEQYTHISLWSLWASPLLIGCPLERLDRFTLSLLTNDEVIAVNQDPLGVMAETVVERDGVEVLVKPLADGSLAVGLFNRNDKPTTVTASWSDLGLTGRAVVRDLWRQQDIGGESEAFAREIAPHGVVFVRITPEETVRQ